MECLKRKFLQGRITDNEVWQKKITDICAKWLNKTPTISVKDSGNGMRLRKKSIQVWQAGSLLLALKEAGFVNVSFEKAQISIAKEFNCNDITDSDFGLLCFALYDISDNNFLEDKFIEYLKNNLIGDNIVSYKANIKSAVFVDTLGFVCPFLTKYGILHNKTDYIEFAKKQISNYLEKGVEPHCKLPFHAYDVKTGTYLGICDWARGTAWLLIALMDSYLCLQEKDIQDNFYLAKIKEYADIICNLQKPGGAFSWQLLKNNDSDSSATAVFGWYLVNSYMIFGDEKYLNTSQRCRAYLRSVTFNNGVIDYCQGDTMSIGIYSRLFDKMPFAQGFALRMQNRLKDYE